MSTASSDWKIRKTYPLGCRSRLSELPLVRSWQRGQSTCRAPKRPNVTCRSSENEKHQQASIYERLTFTSVKWQSSYEDLSREKAFISDSRSGDRIGRIVSEDWRGCGGSITVIERSGLWTRHACLIFWVRKIWSLRRFNWPLTWELPSTRWYIAWTERRTRSFGTQITQRFFDFIFFEMIPNLLFF